MDYSKQIGEVLAETLNELFVVDDLKIPLNEIRDLATLKGHMQAAEAKYGTKHAKYQALASLHAKKEAADAHKAERQTRIKSRQEFHAKNFGYSPVKGSRRNQWVHKDTGHKLTFGADRSWSHMKTGGKRAKGGNATPIRDLRRHLSKLHEDVELQGDVLNEIRGLDRLRQRANAAMLKGDSRAQQELQQVLALHRRKSRMALFPEEETINEKEVNGYNVVKRYKDAHALYCPTCDKLWHSDSNPMWGINKTKGMHEKGSGHKTHYIAPWPEEK